MAKHHKKSRRKSSAKRVGATACKAKITSAIKTLQSAKKVC